MAGGKRFKFTGSLIKTIQNWSAHSPAQTITAITKANPAVVSVTNHGFVDGDVVYIAGVVGMTEVNGGTFVVNQLTTGTFELVDTNSTGYGTYSSGGKVDQATFTNFCELTGYNRAGGSSAEIDAETLCSTAKEYEIGLPDFGTTTLDYNFAPKTSLQVALIAAYKAGSMVAMRISLPNSGGEMTQLGFVQSMSEQAAKAGLWTGNLVMRNTGPRYDQ